MIIIFLFIETTKKKKKRRLGFVQTRASNEHDLNICRLNIYPHFNYHPLWSHRGGNEKERAPMIHTMTWGIRGGLNASHARGRRESNEAKVNTADEEKWKLSEYEKIDNRDTRFSFFFFWESISCLWFIGSWCARSCLERVNGERERERMSWILSYRCALSMQCVRWYLAAAPCSDYLYQSACLSLLGHWGEKVLVYFLKILFH